MPQNLLLLETKAEVQVEWKIERFLSLFEDMKYDELHSPAFSLSDAQWYLEMYLNSTGWIVLYLNKRFSTSKAHVVKFTLGIRRSDGSVFKSIDFDYQFRVWNEPGMNPFVRLSELKQSENVLAADGSITMFAILRLTEPNDLDEDRIVDISRELPFRAKHSEEVSSEWKVEDFTSLPEEQEDFSLKSPTFSLAGATWCMKVFPNGDKCDEPGWVTLYLSRESSSSQKQTVAYTLGTLRRDGTPHRLYHDEEEFYPNTFCGRKRLIKSSELLDSDDELVSEGSVTFFCTARAIFSPLTTAAITEGGPQTSSDASHEERTSQTIPPEQGKTAQASLRGIQKLLKHVVVSGHGDVTFNVKDQAFPAHRSILALRSPVFFEMFHNDTEEKRTGIVTVTDLQPDTVQFLLSFIYTGEVSLVSSKNAAELYKAANKYDIPDLKDAALRYMTQEPSP